MREIVINILREVYGLPLTLETTIDETLEMEENDNLPNEKSEKNEVLSSEQAENGNIAGDDMMLNLLKSFGGKIVG
jgi:hypothetical protein